LFNTVTWNLILKRNRFVVSAKNKLSDG